MAKRHLNSEERAITLKSISRLKEEIEYHKYQKEFCELKLNKGLEMEHRKQVRDFKNALRDFESEIKMAEEKLKVLNDQLKRGVEIKMKGGK
jgi:hypothetical protein